MRYSEQYIQQEPHEGYLKLAKKDENNRTISLGVKHLQILFDEVGTKVNFATSVKEKAIWYHFRDLDTGELLRYGVPLYNKQGELHYLIQKLGTLKENSYLNMEYKRKDKGMGGYVSVEPVSKTPQNAPESPTRGTSPKSSTNTPPKQKTIIKKVVPTGNPDKKQVGKDKVVEIEDVSDIDFEPLSDE